MTGSILLSQAGQTCPLVSPVPPQKTHFPAGFDMSNKAPDPTKDPEFQKIVQTFLRTKPQPHKRKPKAVKEPKRKKET
jgi:hypothetical protein